MITKLINNYYCIADSSTISFNNPPKRPMEITDTEKTSCDVPLDDNTRIVLSLDVFYQSNETAVRVSSIKYCAMYTVRTHICQGFTQDFTLGGGTFDMLL